MSFPIPPYRSPLRDVAESLEGGMNSIAAGLTQARVTRENRDTEARQNASSLTNQLATEIARLNAAPKLDEESQARLAELNELAARAQTVLSATGSGEAANMWAAIMQESPIATTMGSAAGSATRLERELVSTQRVEDANFNNLNNFYSFLMNPDLNNPQFSSLLASQLAVIESMAASGFALPTAAQPMLEGMPDAIMALRGTLAGDPRYRAHIERLDRIQVAAADRAGIDVAVARGGLLENAATRWRESGQYDPALREELIQYTGLGEAQFDSLTQEYQGNAQRNTRIVMEMNELALTQLGIQVDSADAALAMSRYRNNREQLLDQVNDATTAQQYAFGAAMSGDVGAIAGIIADIQSGNERGQHYLASGLTVDGLRKYLQEAGQNENFRTLQRDTARADLTRSLAAANRGLITDELQGGMEILRGAALVHGVDGAAQFYDDQPEHVKALLGPRETAIATMRTIARTNDLVAGEPLRNHALGQVQMLMSLPLAWDANGALSEDGYNMMISRLYQVNELLTEHMGPDFAAQFSAGAFELLQQGATRDAWEMHKLVANVQLLRSQAGLLPDGTPRPNMTTVDVSGLRDGFKDAISAVESNATMLMTQMSQMQCVTLTGSGVGSVPTSTPGANAPSQECQEMFANYDAQQLLLAGFSQELSALAYYQLSSGARMPTAPLPVDRAAPSPVPSAPGAYSVPTIPPQPPRVNPYLAPSASEQPAPAATAPAPQTSAAPARPPLRQGVGIAASAGYTTEKYPIVTPEFESQLGGVVERLSELAGVKIDPRDLLDIMNLESSLDPEAINSESGATGLIQFTDIAAKDLGVPMDVIRQMPADEQLDLVERYFAMRMRRDGLKEALETTDDPLRELYMAVLWPVAMGEGPDYVLFRDDPAALDVEETPYFQNRGLDINRDGVITAAEAVTKVRRNAPVGGAARVGAASAEPTTMGPFARESVRQPEVSAMPSAGQLLAQGPRVGPQGVMAEGAEEEGEAPVELAPNQSGILPNVTYSQAILQQVGGRDSWWWEDEFYADEDPELTIIRPGGRRARVSLSEMRANPDVDYVIAEVPREPTVRVTTGTRGRVTTMTRREAAERGLLREGM